MRRVTSGAMRRLAVGGATAVAVIGLMAGPASAHYTYLSHGQDFASINQWHTSISVCNQERDSNPVRATVTTAFGPRYYYDRSEDGRCATHDRQPLYALTWRLCEVNVGCTEPRSL
jgi:hypothetical protein